MVDTAPADVAEPPAAAPLAGPARPGWRVGLAWTLTALAGALVFYALVGPDDLSQLGLLAFLRIPVEGLAVAALLLVVRPRARTGVAIAVGLLFGLLTIVKLFNMGFNATLARPFDPVSDWSFLPPAVDYLRRTYGRLGEGAAVLGAFVLAVAILGLMTLAMVRLTRLLSRHRAATTRGVAALTVLWVACAAFGVTLTTAGPVASTSAAGVAYEQARQAVAEVHDRSVFRQQLADDPYQSVPPNELLTALHGKDVLLTFVESYGRVAVQDSDIAPGVDALLDQGTQQLKAAGFGARSAFVTSSTAGGGSWLAHSTLQSGLFIDTEQRYDTLTASHRLTLTGAFDKAGWHTAYVSPATTQDWPEGAFYGYQTVYDARNLGYKGPHYSFDSTPDQYTMKAVQGALLAQPGHTPVMAEIDLVSSHAPWEPVPQLINWDYMGNGSGLKKAATGNPKDMAGNVDHQATSAVHADYAATIRYSLNTLITWLLKYGNENTVMVFLGDHQPAPVVAGVGATRDAPITIVAKDPKVLDRIASWGWQDGLRPDPHAPTWRMDTFRDKFFQAFA
jgi:hypothetical protein